MYLFKTSGATFESVIRFHKHAFERKPVTSWEQGEMVLISKNKMDCSANEKQIRFLMRIENIRRASDDEIEACWPGNAGRWKYIVDCSVAERVSRQFDLREVLGTSAREYKTVQLFKKMEPDHEALILKWLAFG